MIEFIPYEEWRSIPIETRRRMIEQRKTDASLSPGAARIIEEFEREIALYIKPEPEGVRETGWQI